MKYLVVFDPGTGDICLGEAILSAVEVDEMKQHNHVYYVIPMESVADYCEPVTPQEIASIEEEM